jgi:N-methylhydantoinase B
VSASWGHTNGCNIAGWNSQTQEEYVTMVLATLISGAGATPQQDGWHACGPQSCFGALTSGDVELLEYSYPIIIHQYSLMTDSGGAGKFRGGSGTCWEVEPIDEPMTFVMFGEGRRLPAMGAANAHSTMIDSKVGKVEFNRSGEIETTRINVIATINPGETATNKNPGGGGYGDPFQRPIEKIVRDVRNNLVSLNGAREDYGVIIKSIETLEVDDAATGALRRSRANQSSGMSIQSSVKSPTLVDAVVTEARKPVIGRSSDQNSRIASQSSAFEISKELPPPLTGADVGFIKIVDSDKQSSNKKGKKIKVRYF